MADETFGQRLRGHRITARLSQHKLAEAAGFDHTYICYLEAGKRFPPSREAVDRLSDALGLDPGSPERDRLFLLSGHIPPDVPVERLLLTCQMVRRGGLGG